MTTIRKIVTSKIDGNNSNATDTNEIRPYGEISLYVGDNDKLELLMFDGLRTHVKSKVLNKGTFYGGDADSSDGLNRDTIKLVPDEVLRREGSDQYLVIDPTIGEPGHIHIRAGGAIDSSTADLFLGGEKNHVRVSDTNDRVIISADVGDGSTSTWTFIGDGSLTFPDGTTQTTAYTGAGGAGTTSTLVNGTWTVSLSTSGELTLLTGALSVMPDLLGYPSLKVAPEQLFSITGEGTAGVVALNWASDFSDYGNSSNAALIINSPFAGSPGTVQVVVNTSATTKSWVYDAEGKFVLPGGGNVVGNDYSVNIVGGNDGSSTYGDVNITTNNPFRTKTRSFGTMGELTLPSGGEITSGQITNEVFGTTTTSLTLVPGGATEPGQRLEIYATVGGEGNHLHLTAGESPTALYLGNDSQYVRLGSMGEIEVSAQSGLTLWGQGVMSNTYLILPNNIDSSSTSVTLGNVNGDVLIQASQPGNPVPQNWFFGRDGYLTFPSGGNITFDSSATSYVYGISGIEFADSTIQTTAFTGTAATLDILDTNGLTTVYYPTFVENRTNGQTVRADVDFTYRTDDNLLTVGNVTVNSLFKVGKTHEAFSTSTTATSTVNYNCAATQIFFHSTTGTVANWTANLTNLGLDSGRATTVAIVINQGTTGYYPSVLQIGGVAQTIMWQGNTSPTVNANRVDVVAFSILNNNGTYTVLGQLTGF